MYVFIFNRSNKVVSLKKKKRPTADDIPTEPTAYIGYSCYIIKEFFLCKSFLLFCLVGL